MPTYIQVEEFVERSKSLPVIDVRAPVEFTQGHIPGAKSIPLFDDSQRAEIGTLYKRQGRRQSLIKGLEFVGPKMKEFAKAALRITNDGEQPALVHCWRGGMRSRSFAWLLEQVEIETFVLQGGYKAYRRWTLESFKTPLQLIVLSGLTGSGKTNQLNRLSDFDEQIVDLEHLANHRGSAFGGIGQGGQPTSEQFENSLAIQLSNLDISRRIWVEDESRRIGANRLPHHFFEQLRTAPAIFMDVDRETRTRLIDRDYGDLDNEELVAAIERITKRLGGQNMKLATEYLRSGNMQKCIAILLEYYDKLYLANKDKLPRDIFLNLETSEPESAKTSGQLISLADSVSDLTIDQPPNPPAQSA